MNALENFLGTSPVAKRIRLESMLVVHRTKLSPRGIVVLGEAGAYSFELGAGESVELQVGESVIAEGTILEDSGEFYFEVSDVFNGSQNNKEEGDEN